MDRIIPEIRRSLASMPKRDARSFHLLRREWSGRLKDSSGASVVALAKQLVQAGLWERVFGYELIAYHPAALEALGRKDIRVLGRGMRGWEEVDCFARDVAGRAWRRHRISDQVVLSWARSPDRWWRRAALVSTVPLNNRKSGGPGNAGRTLRLCRMLIRDRDDMVVKALSWALRELSKRDRQAVMSFLDRYDEDLAPRIKREVRNKLLTGLKNPRPTLSRTK